jgi:hypothetical protein
VTLTADFNSSVTVPFQRMRALLLESGGGLQEGIVGVTDAKVAQRGAGANQTVDVPAGAMWITIDTGTRNGVGHVYNDATANVAVSASNATNPRIDQLVCRWNDSSIPTGSGNVPTFEVVTGTATAGATLDNRTGAAALPNDCLRLADILVPATSTSVVTANIRDRRPWARGAYRRIMRTAANYTTATTPLALMDATNLQPRIECSGVPLRFTLRGVHQHSAASATAALWGGLDGSIFDGASGGSADVFVNVSTVTMTQFNVSWDTVPAAGSHLVGVFFATVTTGTYTVGATTTNPLVLTVEEIVKPSADNS